MTSFENNSLSHAFFTLFKQIVQRMFHQEADDISLNGIMRRYLIVILACQLFVARMCMSIISNYSEINQVVRPLRISVTMVTVKNEKL